MTDAEFVSIMEMGKHIKNGKAVLPKAGDYSRIDVLSDSTADCFILDIDRRSTITLTRRKLQERYIGLQENLIRLEIDGRPHTNPDGTMLSGNHIHIFKEGFGLSYAYELSSFKNGYFLQATSFFDLFSKFCEYCNINLKGITIQDVI